MEIKCTAQESQVVIPMLDQTQENTMKRNHRPT